LEFFGEAEQKPQAMHFAGQLVLVPPLVGQVAQDEQLPAIRGMGNVKL